MRKMQDSGHQTAKFSNVCEMHFSEKEWFPHVQSRGETR